MVVYRSIVCPAAIGIFSVNVPGAFPSTFAPEGSSIYTTAWLILQVLLPLLVKEKFHIVFSCSASTITSFKAISIEEQSLIHTKVRFSSYVFVTLAEVAEAVT